MSASRPKTLKKTGRNVVAAISALIIVAVGVGIAWAMSFGAGKLPIKQYFSRDYTNAIWDWSSPVARSQQDVSNISDFMYFHQLNAVYVNVGQYAAALGSPETPQKAAQQKQLDDALARYVSTLGRRHIKVYGVAGDVDWSNPPEWHMPLSIMQAVERYNGRNPQARLAGVEFDIESYNQPGFSRSSMTAKGLVLGDYLSMVDTLATADAAYVKDTSHSLELGFTIPYWFDDENGNIPPVTWGDKTGPTLYHLLDRLNQLPKSNVLVMAYRNAAKGNDGVIFHARTEVDYAQAKAPNVRVMIGQETTDVTPAKITYFGKSAAELSDQIKLIEDAFAGSGVLGGIAINDLAGYEQMSSGD